MEQKIRAWPSSMSSSTKILIGLVLGVSVGLFLGEHASVFKIAADGFVKLLQMTVLPYITLSIITSLGALTYDQVKTLGLRAGVVLIGLWSLALTFTFLFPLAFPDVETASFFSTTLVEQRRPFNFIDLFIPSNPFYALSNNVVPAVVLFSVFVGVALIGVERKQTALDVFAVAKEALSRATKFVVGLTPYGIFAIAANTAGTLNLEQVARIQVYLITYVLIATLIALWVLPGLVSALTPFSYREVLGPTRDALITAFMAGDLFIVLPILIQACKDLLEGHRLVDEHTRTLPDVIVPTSFNFPHTGKLLSISFILFAGWFANATVSVTEYPRLALTGLMTFFGSLNAAVPFLLDLFRIPADTFQLFLATGVVNSRFGALLAAVHTVTVALLGSAAIVGALRFNPARVVRYLVITVALSAASIGGLRMLFNSVLKPAFAGEELVYSMRPLMPHEDVRVIKSGDIGDASEKPTGSVIDSIKKRGALRVGVVSNRLPYVLANRQRILVGLDVEMAQLLGRDLGVKVELVELEDLAALSPLLASGRIDLAMSGVAVTPERASEMLFSEPYLDETLAFVVKDHLRDQFSTWAAIRELGAFSVAIPNLPYYIEKIRMRAPALKLTPVDSGSQIEANLKQETFDAVVMPAESGSVMSLIYPKYTVVVPEPDIVKIPLAYPLARRDQDWAHFINTWIELKRRDGTIDALYGHWILGKQAGKRQPRWSIMRNVLHWVD
jgi:Na+/H+-dicarboxylate symporter/ABC-type amino acid transport substrate-binding protein